MTYSVMAVCTGNICRSPMAEIVLRSHLTAAGLDREVTVSSTAVTSEELGNPIDPRARRVLTEAGYVVEQHQARRVQVADVVDTDLALAMSAQHVRALRGFGFDQERVALFRAFEHGVPDEPIWQVSAPDTPTPGTAITETSRTPCRSSRPAPRTSCSFCARNSGSTPPARNPPAPAAPGTWRGDRPRVRPPASRHRRWSARQT